MQDWFRELNTYLTVAVDYEHHTSRPDLNETVTVRFTVTNSASPPQPGSTTEVRFDRVLVRVGLPSGMESIEVGVLRPGDLTTVEYQCQVSELPDIEYDVSGDISTQALFHVEPIKGNRLPGGREGLSPRVYFQLIKDVNVHQWLNSTIKGFPLPGADTTLAQLSELATPLNDAIMQIRSALERLTRLSQYVSRRNQQDLEALNGYRREVEKYLTETDRRIGEIRQTLASSDVSQIARAVQGATDRLEREAAQVDKATDEMTARFASS